MLQVPLPASKIFLGSIVYFIGVSEQNVLSNIVVAFV
jgi:hypothetical protein